MEDVRPSLLRRLVAVLVLAVAAWILFKVIISVIAGVAWFLAIVVLIVGAVWAMNTLRR